VTTLLPADPFLEREHRALFDRLHAFGEKRLRSSAADESDPEGQTRRLVAAFGEAGLLKHALPPPFGSMDLRSLVVAREALAYYSSLADTAFVMQGLGSFAISHAGTDVQRQTWLPPVARGELLAAFAVTEPGAGSDLAGVRTEAVREGALWKLRGVKTLISNAGLAGVYTVLARTSEAAGHDGLSMFLVDGEAPGIAVRRLELIAPHPIGEVRFEDAPALLLGEEGSGFKIAVATLEHFRPSVGAAACGLAGRALIEAVRHTQSRRQFGRPLSEFQAVRMALAEMHVDLESARLLVLKAAWTKDQGAATIAREGAAAKLAATEMAQRVVDRALQLHGGQGVLKGSTVERLYREVRALRIYEGTSEIQKLVIARSLLKESR
jgi:acyl-CoA dehydrogenase